MTKFLVGYHRVSDDSVNTAQLDATESIKRLLELRRDPDVDQYWARDAQGRILSTWSNVDAPEADIQESAERLNKYTQHYARGLMTGREYMDYMNEELSKIVGN